MTKKIASILVALILIFTLAGPSLALTTESGDIVILYTNDVHCSIDTNIGYAGLAAYKAEMETQYGEAKVTLIDAGDAVQGGAVGTLSEGAYIVDIMNEMGYDIMVPGNHEFDYGMERMQELMAMMKASVLSCNFKSLATNKTVYSPYRIIDYGNLQVAYIGITTPKSYTSSTPKFFQDDKGNYIYSFCEGSDGAALYSEVQSAVDAAKGEGADVIIAVAHCGVGDDLSPFQSSEIIANTTGIAAVIDGHSHSIIPSEVYKNKNGEDVILTSSGTALKNIGKLVISSDSKVSSTLISDYTAKDAGMTDYVNSIKVQYETLLNKVVAESDVPLIITDPATGKRLIRNSETNLGDLAADAYRILLGADIAVVNGGGIRANIEAGEITYGEIIAVHPFGNAACVVEATGQEILDLLEMGARSAPGESGGFIQVSGLSYEIYTYIPSTVVLDEKGNFSSVSGQRRVKNVLVGGAPLELNKTYTLASHNYLLKNGGDGNPMFMDNKLLQDEVMLDNQVLITYIVDKLGGVVGYDYSSLYGQGRIKVYTSPYDDVKLHFWYTDSVGFVYTGGYMAGLSEDSFAPDNSISRADFISLLYKLKGSPQVTGSASDYFTDCEAGAPYDAALLWAYNSGIAKGVAGGRFNPTALLTREEAAVFLYRYTNGSAETFTSVLSYTDSEGISGWAYDAVSYCTYKGLMKGLDNGAFAPDISTTRAMSAVLASRLAALN